ncbi:MAG: UdgX family uracil-DNA binding protein [Gammaproteobacteria bacterium]|nr:MAG: UdgX family uracil-DNA binding protein [Gammaproteobacteria bacterium]
MKPEDTEPQGGGKRPQDHTGNNLTGARTLSSLQELRAAVNECKRCPLWKAATQGVPGEGLVPSALMLVGEGPGDSEDLRGQPFVGPAGGVLDQALHAAGLDRRSVYISNAVKHFKFESRGKRRLHIKPSTGEIEACRWWLAEELRLVGPKLVMALGATAARAILGQPVTVSQTRGVPTRLSASAHLWVTIHPSLLLRITDEAQRHKEFDRFVQELKDALAWIAKNPS